MNNTGNHNQTWSDTDIRKYLEGELSVREMHDLEKAALDDPFLADALEGLAVAPSPEADIGELRSRLAARVEKKESKPIVAWLRKPAYRMAAATVLLAGLGVAAYYTLFYTGKSRLNVDVVAKSGHERAARQTPVAADSTKLSLDSAATGSYANVDNDLAEKKQAQPALPADNEVAANNRPARRRSSPSRARIADSLDTGLALNAPPPAANATSQYRSSYLKKADMATDSMSYDAEPVTLSGRVVDFNNRPLAGALLSVNGYQNIGTRTDVYGNFKLRFQPRDTTQQMTVALNGYKQASFNLNTSTLSNNILRLQEASPSLNEVVITGYGAKRKETLAAAPFDDSSERLDSAWLKVYPIIGKLAYQQYLDSARRALRLDTAIHGNERISFQVDQKGQISEFKIEQSVSPAHDAGVIQLINGGPAWKLLRGKKARALVSLSFP